MTGRFCYGSAAYHTRKKTGSLHSVKKKNSGMMGKRQDVLGRKRRAVARSILFLLHFDRLQKALSYCYG